MDPDVSSPTNTSDQRRHIQHLMVDLGIQYGQHEKLAAVLSLKMHQKIKRNTLAMALSGYRQTKQYGEYLNALQAHLEECLTTGKNPVTLYTDPAETQDEKKGVS